jgi:adhesin/invasin
MLRDISLKLPVLLVVALLGCGGDDGGTPPPTTAISKGSGSGDGQTGIVGQPLANPIRVTVTDGGAPLAGATINWSTTAAGAELAASTVTDASGVASNAWRLGTVSGSQTAQASLTGASGSPLSFTATAAPDIATTLSEFGGNQQRAPINTQLSAPVQAKVADQFGNGVPGVSVEWSADNATTSAASVPTDASGVSGVTVTAGPDEGPIIIIATSGTLVGSPVNFTATAGPPAPVTADVTVVNDAFQPSTLTISAGTMVVWTWAPGAVGHNVTPAGTQPTGSGGLASAPNTHQFTFNTPGTYVYYCIAHGTPAGGMRGTITVQ